MSTKHNLIVKLTEDTALEEGEGLIRSALGREVVDQMEPLFPGEKDPELATIFCVSLAENASVADAIATLTRDRHVQYAHLPQLREEM